jgi:hypothetical protein
MRGKAPKEGGDKPKPPQPIASPASNDQAPRGGGSKKRGQGRKSAQSNEKKDLPVASGEANSPAAGSNASQRGKKKKKDLGTKKAPAPAVVAVVDEQKVRLQLFSLHFGSSTNSDF